MIRANHPVTSRVVSGKSFQQSLERPPLYFASAFCSAKRVRISATWVAQAGDETRLFVSAGSASRSKSCSLSWARSELNEQDVG